MKIYVKNSISTSDIKSIRKNLFLYYGILKNETEDFLNTYDDVVDVELETNEVDDELRYKVYKKYLPLAKKCKEIADNIVTDKTGHMADQIIRLEMQDMAEEVLEVFPYEWG